MPEGFVERRLEHMAAWTATTSSSYAPAVVVVSGHAPVAAVQVVTALGVSLVSDNVDPASLSFFRPGSVLWERLRCHNLQCRAWLPPQTPHPQHLGWVGFCLACTAKATRACERRYGRLPVDGGKGSEFFCPYCNTMRRHPEDRCSPERVRKQTVVRVRIKCWPCRQQDLLRRRARERRRNRRAAVARGGG